jgi:hypothetical protein
MRFNQEHGLPPLQESKVQRPMSKVYVGDLQLGRGPAPASRVQSPASTVQSLGYDRYGTAALSTPFIRRSIASS